MYRVRIAKAHDAGPGPQVRARQQGPVVAARAEAEPRARSATEYAANRHARAQTARVHCVKLIKGKSSTLSEVVILPSWYR